MSRIVSLIAGFVLVIFTALATGVAAQESTPEVDLGRTLPAVLLNTEETPVAVALVAEIDEEISVNVVAVGLVTGEHGIHIHETGICDPTTDPPFDSAGGHYNPTDEEHGDHAGDLGNITAEEDGTAHFEEMTDNFTLDELIDEDGSAIIIHAEEDENDPEGESYGSRIACGVLAEPEVEEPTEVPATPPTATEPVATEVPATPPVATEPVVTEEAPSTPEADAVDAVDSDEDGLVDTDELDIGTDPALFDSDEDGLGDGAEFNEFGTDPLVFDSDEDGVGDGDEVDAGTDPLDAESV